MSAETTFWTPPETDVYGLMVYGEGAWSDGAFDLQVTWNCFYDGLVDGSTTFVSHLENSFFRFDPSQPYWGVVSGRPEPGSGDSNLTLFSHWNSDYMPSCVETLVGSSLTPGEGADFIVADFGVTGMGDYYLNAYRTDDSEGEYFAQWNESEGVVGAGWSDSCAVYDSFIANIETTCYGTTSDDRPFLTIAGEKYLRRREIRFRSIAKHVSQGVAPTVM